MEAEKLVWDAHACGRIEATSIRPVMVWGPRDLAYFTKMIGLIKKRMFMYINGGNHIAGLSHVRNVCEAVIKAAVTEEAKGKAFIITDGCETTLRAVVERLCDELHLPKPRLSISSSTAKTLAGASEWYYRKTGAKSTPMLTKMGIGCIGNNLSFNISRAVKVLGYTPKYVFPNGLQDYIVWYKSEYLPGISE